MYNHAYHLERSEYKIKRCRVPITRYEYLNYTHADGHAAQIRKYAIITGYRNLIRTQNSSSYKRENFRRQEGDSYETMISTIPRTES